MIDELNELRQANPENPDALANHTFMDRAALIDALDADARLPLSPVPALRRTARKLAALIPVPLGILGGVAAAVGLAVIVMIGAGRLDDSTSKVDVGTPPTTTPITTPDSLPFADSTSTTTTTVPDPAPTAAPTSAPSISAPSTSAPSISTPSTSTPSISTPAAGAPSTTTPPSESAVAPPTTAVKSTPPVLGPFDPATDLLALHFDFAHRDDGHAVMADREIATHFGLDPLVVAGTQAAESSNFVHPYTEMMTAAFGTSWLDAGANRAGSISAATGAWLTVLDAGGNVWIAEGGVSDFSAEVIREVQLQRPGLDLGARVHIVQHAQRNEDETTADDVALVFSATDYVRIDDGNNPNDSADLFGASGSLEAAALAGPRASGWTTAFNYMAAAELDFSDTVEVLHIVGVGTNQVANADDFAAYFMVN